MMTSVGADAPYTACMMAHPHKPNFWLNAIVNGKETESSMNCFSLCVLLGLKIQNVILKNNPKDVSLGLK